MVSENSLFPSPFFTPARLDNGRKLESRTEDLNQPNNRPNSMNFLTLSSFLLFFLISEIVDDCDEDDLS